MRLIKSSVVGLAAAALTIATGVGVSSAQAEALSPWWNVSFSSRPTALTPGSSGQLVVWAQNLGDAATSGNVTVTDVVPQGLRVLGAKAKVGGKGATERGPASCVFKAAGATTVTCTFGEYENSKKEIVHESLPPYELFEVQITVLVSAEASEEEASTASVSGGGAIRTASATRKLTLGEGTEKFGFEEYTLVPEEVGGALDTEAGSHPFQLTSVIALNQQPVVGASNKESAGDPVSVGLAKNLVSELPLGVFGNPTPFAQCTDAQFAKQADLEGEYITNECPADSAVGVATVQFSQPGSGGFTTSTVPIFNVTPRPGEPARFGFKAAGIVSTFLDASVETGGTYAVTVGSYRITQLVSLIDVRLTFWGVPGDTRHNAQRGWECLDDFGICNPPAAGAPPPFLVMPTSCAQPFQSTLHGDTWASSGRPEENGEASYALPEQVDGCNHLPFEPSLTDVPDLPNASSATGLTVGVHVPQESALNPEGLSESSLKDTTVALPAGVAINPSGGDGLIGCGEGLVGFTGSEAGGLERALFTPRMPGSVAAVEAGEFSPLAPGVNFCANESKIATVTIRTPLLAHAIEGAVYIATQNENPFGSLVGLYLVAEDPISGTLLKLPGEVRLCQAPGETVSGMTCGTAGQVITTFKNTPELPFEELELHFFGGERAPLATPARCGAYTTAAAFVPWSGEATVNTGSTFNLTSGPGGSPCPGASLPFSPTLTAGTTNIQAGGFSLLTTTIGRKDGEQNMQAVTVKMPPGVSGLLAGVELCPEPQASQGLCGPNSQIGETTVTAGVGSDPVSVKGGRVYITGPYNGTGGCAAGSPGCAAFGLSIVNPVKAGPFDLERDTANPAQDPPCDCIVVRAKLEIDPISAAITVTTDPSGPHAIPHFIDGVPVQIQKVNVLINRPNFTFNPTNCASRSITGSISSDEGSSSPVSVPYDAANCSTLGFKPQLSVATSGKTSRSRGASLNVKLAYPKAPFGSQANIKTVKVDLPKQLPSELRTLQHACPHEVFEANPAACPPTSRVGVARATTPLIPAAFEGPAYFVSYASLQFPELIIVLQGYNVTVDLHGETFINEKTNVTSSTFHTVPDVPVGSFELTLPEGPFSALGANANLCEVGKTVTVTKRVRKRVGGKTKLVTVKITKKAAGLTMPTLFVAQNGAEIHQSTPIAVTGCAKAKPVAKPGSGGGHKPKQKKKG